MVDKRDGRSGVAWDEVLQIKTDAEGNPVDPDTPVDINPPPAVKGSGHAQDQEVLQMPIEDS